MNRRHFFLVTGLAVAAWLAFWGDKTPSTNLAEPVVRKRPVPVSSAVSIPRQEYVPVILALKERNEPRIGTSIEKAGNLFESHSWTPPPPPPPPPQKPSPPPPPQAPPLPFVYLGKKLDNGVWEVYLGRGEQTFVVQAQGTLEGAYRVESTTPPTLILTYLPLNQKQTLSIGVKD